MSQSSVITSDINEEGAFGAEMLLLDQGGERGPH